MNIEVDFLFNLADTKTGLIMQTIDIIQAYAYRESMRGDYCFQLVLKYKSI